MFALSPYCTHPNLTIDFREEVTSTNTLLRQQAEEGAPEGTVLMAARQTAGRGRRDRSFYSPADTGLYLSILLRPRLAPQEALYLTTCAAASVALALEETPAPMRKSSGSTTSSFTERRSAASSPRGPSTRRPWA